MQDQSSGYRLAKLFLEAQLRQMPATGVEPDLEGMGVFKPMKFQIQAVEWALRQLRPRLLLADAVGLGKTIQVGMILSELMRRGRGDRILVLAKKSMLTQFQSELWNRFGIPLVRLDSAGIAKLRLRIPANKNPFEVYHRVIISIDTLKNVGSYRHFLENTRWDCVVIDEAHNVAGASVPERHLAYRLARLLSRRTDSMLLTTATPHNGKRETFGRLISLLDPSAIPDPDFKEYTAEDIKGFFLMRFKEEHPQRGGHAVQRPGCRAAAADPADASAGEEQVFSCLAALRTGQTAGNGSQHRALVLVRPVQTVPVEPGRMPPQPRKADPAPCTHRSRYTGTRIASAAETRTGRPDTAGIDAIPAPADPADRWAGPAARAARGCGLHRKYRKTQDMLGVKTLGQYVRCRVVATPGRAEGAGHRHDPRRASPTRSSTTPWKRSVPAPRACGC